MVWCGVVHPSTQVLTPEQKYMATATGAMAKPPRPEDLKFKTAEDGYVNIHPGSATAKVTRFETPYLVFHEKVKTSRVFVREVRAPFQFPQFRRIVIFQQIYRT